MGFLKLIALEERIVLDAAAAAVVPTATLYVDANAAAGGDGSSWAHAINNLQDALIKAGNNTTNPGADVIWIAQGNYFPTSTQVEPVSGSPSFIVPDLTSIYGGFKGGTSADANLRNPHLFATILDGNIGDPNLVTDNAVHVVTIGSVTATLNATALLDGLTIENGYAGGLGASSNNGRGGGLFSRNNLSLTINDVNFLDNQARINFTNTAALQAANGFGGGLYMASSGPVGTLTITNSLFMGNVADQFGGGVNVASPQGATYISTTIDNTNFISNHSVLPIQFINNGPRQGEGGAYVASGGLTIIRDSHFLHNTASESGGALVLIFGTANVGTQNLIENCTFIGNTSAAYGGGSILLASTQINANLTINDSLFVNNHAERGAALFSNSMTVSINDSHFIGNTQNSHGVLGMFNGRALANNLPLGTMSISDSTFIGNESTGAPKTAYQMLVYNLVGQSVSPDSHDFGGGALGVSGGGQLNVDGSLFVNNRAPTGGAISVGSISGWRGGTAFLYGSQTALNGSPVAFTLQQAGAVALNVTDSVFINNRATSGDGGAISAKQWTFPADPNYPAYPFNLVSPVTVSVTGSTFTNNRADHNGGALALENSVAPAITANYFHNNRADLLGDAVYDLNTPVNGQATQATILNSLTASNTFKKLDVLDDIEIII